MMEDQKNITPSEVDWLFPLNKNNETRKTSNAPAPDAEIYKKYKRRGTAVIFNHKNFTIRDCSPRSGTDKDRDDLKQILHYLQFDVITHDDLTFAQLVEVLEIVSKMDHSDSDCLLITVMSHGDEEVLYAKDCSYPTKKLWKFFSPLHCPSLAGKPKLFFIQACRGNKTDPGVELSYTESDFSGREKMYSIPVMADFLIMYATVEGYYAWRHPEDGSYFIQSLVHQLKKNCETKDLLSILTCVNREVAIGFTSSEPNYPELSRKKEMCSIVSMLTRQFYLK